MTIRDLIPWKRGAASVPMRVAADPMLSLRRDIDRLFDDLWSGFGEFASMGVNGGIQLPRIDVSETDEALRIEMEVPGMDAKHIDVTSTSSAVTVRGARSEENADERKNYVVRERSSGSFERVVPIPEGVDVDRAKASFKNGVLTVTLPRTEKDKRGSRHIQIENA